MTEQKQGRAPVFSCFFISMELPAWPIALMVFNNKKS